MQQRVVTSWHSLVHWLELFSSFWRIFSFVVVVDILLRTALLRACSQQRLHCHFYFVTKRQTLVGRAMLLASNLCALTAETKVDTMIAQPLTTISAQKYFLFQHNSICFWGGDGVTNAWKFLLPFSLQLINVSHQKNHAKKVVFR